MIPILLMILIMVLSLIPVNDIKERFKHKFTQAKYIKTQLEKYLNIRLSLTTIQNILHIPFFAILAFLWMRFFAKRGVRFKKALIYTFLIIFSSGKGYFDRRCTNGFGRLCRWSSNL